MAKGCDLPPQPSASYQARCLQPLPAQFTDSAQKRVATSNCNCGSVQLECTNPNTKEVRTYPLTREVSGVLTLVDSGNHYIVTIDVASKCVTVRNCVRAISVVDIVVFALDGNGVLCSTSADSTGIVTYIPVVVNPASLFTRIFHA